MYRVPGCGIKGQQTIEKRASGASRSRSQKNPSRHGNHRSKNNLKPVDYLQLETSASICGNLFLVMSMLNLFRNRAAEWPKPASPMGELRSAGRDPEKSRPLLLQAHFR
jgi:hypothetical protein